MKVRKNSMERIEMNSEVFTSMRADFDKLLYRTIKCMLEKDSSSATVALRLDIELMRTSLIDELSDTGVREVIVPKFSHKISSVMQIKTEEKGRTEGVYELTYDDIACKYAVKEIGGDQTTFEQYVGGIK